MSDRTQAERAAEDHEIVQPWSFLPPRSVHSVPRYKVKGTQNAHRRTGQGSRHQRPDHSILRTHWSALPRRPIIRGLSFVRARSRDIFEARQTRATPRLHARRAKATVRVSPTSECGRAAAPVSRHEAASANASNRDASKFAV